MTREDILRSCLAETRHKILDFCQRGGGASNTSPGGFYISTLKEKSEILKDWIAELQGDAASSLSGVTISGARIEALKQMAIDEILRFRRLHDELSPQSGYVAAVRSIALQEAYALVMGKDTDDISEILHEEADRQESKANKEEKD
jgi:hypothetical protein